MLLAVVMVKAHNNALLSPLSRLGRPARRAFRPRHWLPHPRRLPPAAAAAVVVAAAPADQEARHDNHEATEAVWLTPREGLQRYWDGAIDLAPPQIMSLAQLAKLADVAQALALARSRPPTLIAPEPFDEDGCRVICYPGDPRHSIPQPVWDGPTRLTHRNRRFEPEGGLDALLG